MNHDRMPVARKRPFPVLSLALLLPVAAMLQAGIASAAEAELRGSFENPRIMHFDRPVLAQARIRSGLGSLASQGDPAFQMTLRRALDHDIGLRKSIAESHASRQGVWSAMAAYVPTVNATATHSHFRDSGTVRKRSQTLSLDASVTLLDMGTRFHGVKRAKAEALAADYRVLAEEQSVLSEAAAAFFNLNLARKRSHTLKAVRDNIAHLLNLTKRAQGKGFADVGDIALARAELSFIVSDLESARADEEKALNLYRSITGSADMPEGIDHFAAMVAIGDADMESLLQTALRRNPRIRAAFASAEAASHGARETLGKYLPKLTLYSTYERERLSRQDNSWAVGVRLNVPLLDARSVPEVRKARYQSAAAIYAAQDTRQEVERRLREIWADRQGFSGQVQALDTAVSELDRATEVKRKQYRSGYASLRDVLQVERDLLDARLKRDRAVSQRDTAAFRLFVELGL